ncbi:hypothetical protein TRFO_26139 [Tritrichomonas foetus]|uniref:CLASP N-terminal domain-containing protein n=1 Tax=Tritrichomonas foetus TaxID=1144522 RepID=A0A1J4K4N3_9EUKA|nr:hypothetical protein TRFO_26139 [Tritrichomonas foetus]|eukprot:OHT05930.1 hypothetical protein TRFO_26139 [Tritrichomonas foetus]
MKKSKKEIQQLSEQFNNPLDLVEPTLIMNNGDAENYLSEIEAKLKNRGDWSARSEGIILALSCLKGGITNYSFIDYSSISSELASCVTDLRSALVRSGSLLIAASAQVLKEKYVTSIKAVIPALFKQLMHGTALISDSCHFALLEIVKNVQNSKTYHTFISKIQSKSGQHRLAIAEMICIVLEQWPNSIVNPLTENISSSLQILIDDASQNVRRSARRAMLLLKSKNSTEVSLVKKRAGKHTLTLSGQKRPVRAMAKSLQPNSSLTKASHIPKVPKVFSAAQQTKQPAMSTINKKKIRSFSPVKAGKKNSTKLNETDDNNSADQEGIKDKNTRSNSRNGNYSSNLSAKPNREKTNERQIDKQNGRSIEKSFEKSSEKKSDKKYNEKNNEKYCEKNSEKVKNRSFKPSERSLERQSKSIINSKNDRHPKKDEEVPEDEFEEQNSSNDSSGDEYSNNYSKSKSMNNRHNSNSSDKNKNRSSENEKQKNNVSINNRPRTPVKQMSNRPVKFVTPQPERNQKVRFVERKDDGPTIKDRDFVMTLPVVQPKSILKPAKFPSVIKEVVIDQYMPPKSMEDADNFQQCLEEIVDAEMFEKLNGIEDLLCASIISAAQFIPMIEEWESVLPTLFSEFPTDFKSDIHELIIAFRCDPWLISICCQDFGVQYLAELFSNLRGAQMKAYSFRFFCVLFSLEVHVNITDHLRLFLLKLLEQNKGSEDAKFIEAGLAPKPPGTKELCADLIESIKVCDLESLNIAEQLNEYLVKTPKHVSTAEKILQNELEAILEATQIQDEENLDAEEEIINENLLKQQKCLVYSVIKEIPAVSFTFLVEPMINLLCNDDQEFVEATKECLILLMDDRNTFSFVLELLASQANDNDEVSEQCTLNLLLSFFQVCSEQIAVDLLPETFNQLSPMLESCVTALRRIVVLIFVEFKCKIPNSFEQYSTLIPTKHQKLIELYTSRRKVRA